MQDFVVYEAEVFKLFVLVAARISGLVMTAPFLSSSSFPAIAKIGFVFLFAALITPVVPAIPGGLPSDTVRFALMGGAEVLIGMIMGFVMTLLFGALQVAGQLMDMQSGFGMMNVFNPAMETQFPIFGFFLYLIAVLLLLSLNGHHVMLRAIVLTFDRIPIGGLVLRPEMALEVSRWGKMLFVDGVLLAAPVVGALVAAYAVLGLLGRMVPQVQLFAVGFPVTIALSLLVMALSVGLYTAVLGSMFRQMFQDVSTVLRAMT